MKWILSFLLIIVIAIGGAALWLDHYAKQPIPIADDKVELRIKQGSGIRSAARQVAEAGIGIPAPLFELIARISKREPIVRAGIYDIRAGMTPLQLIDKLARGDVVQAEVRFIEGWTFRQLRKVLLDHPDLMKESRDRPDAEVLKLIGAQEPHPEGLFFPDTYRFARGTTDLAVLRLAYLAMRKHLDTAWAKRDSSVPLENPYQALILASIIEKETGRPEERGQVGAVFANRLRIGMKLQTDPTVIYGLGEQFDGNLRKRDLISDTPYNTYTRFGLPPTPIALPGLASLEAAVKPPTSEALYFVARGNGTSEFSATLDEHNRAVSKYQRGGR